MPPRLTVVGDLERADHYYLTEGHRCYFWGEYTPYEHTNGLKWNFSPTNQLIANLKKKMDRQGQRDWPHKIAAIDRVGWAFSQLWRWQELSGQRAALVPMPPSRARIDPMYDPRMLQVLHSVAAYAGLPLDIRDCLGFDGTLPASHESNERPSPETLVARLAFDVAAGRPDEAPGVILLFDDMLTTGAHFVAAAHKLGEVFPGVPIAGNFVARRIIPNPFADLT